MAADLDRSGWARGDDDADDDDDDDTKMKMLKKGKMKNGNKNLVALNSLGCGS